MIVIILAVLVSLVVFYITLCAVDTFMNNWRITPTIWTYWDSEMLPEVVEKCISTWKQHNPSRKIVVLNKGNYRNYVDIDVFSLKHCDSVQRATDFIRLLILREQGGVWMDATTILSRPLDWIDGFPSSEFVGFQLQGFTTNAMYPIIESWFLAAAKGSPFMAAWCEELLRINTFDSISEYVAHAEGSVDLQNLILREYLAIHVAAQVVLQRHQLKDDFSMTILSADGPSGPLHYLSTSGWDSKKALEKLCACKEHTRPPIAKLRGLERGVLMDDKEMLLKTYKCCFGPED